MYKDKMQPGLLFINTVFDDRTFMLLHHTNYSINNCMQVIWYDIEKHKIIVSHYNKQELNFNDWDCIHVESMI